VPSVIAVAAPGASLLDVVGEEVISTAHRGRHVTAVGVVIRAVTPAHPLADVAGDIVVAPPAVALREAADRRRRDPAVVLRVERAPRAADGADRRLALGAAEVGAIARGRGVAPGKLALFAPAARRVLPLCLRGEAEPPRLAVAITLVPDHAVDGVIEAIGTIGVAEATPGCTGPLARTPRRLQR
jgi:hypothetical protein